MTPEKETRLKQLSTQVRLGAVEGVFCAASGHPGGSLSIADILTYLYYEEMNVRPEDPKWEDRDRFVLSKGHTAPALYAVLAQKGFFPKEDLKQLRQVGCHLQGHPDMKGTPGIDMSTGSLGLGLSAACGMALGAKKAGKSFRVYSIIGDGESEEGQIWEAAMFAAYQKLDNLCLFVDYNKLQIDGAVADIVNPAPFEDKFRAFGWHVITIDGHDFGAIEAALNEAKATKGQPTAIIADTVKGKGVSFMEHQVGWHGSAPNAEQYQIAVAELTAQLQ